MPLIINYPAAALHNTPPQCSLLCCFTVKEKTHSFCISMVMVESISSSPPHPDEISSFQALSSA
ncbi:hypothetical protein LINPERPRIM_LOCUS11541, partial [Linum perenne]